MNYLIIEMREGSGWRDSQTQYEFPARYLRQFDAALSGGIATALVYEPKRDGGRRAFVAWTMFGDPPRRATGARAFTINFIGGLRSFTRPVPFSMNGVPAEWRLREFPPTHYGRALQGRAVREVPEGNAIEILLRGGSDALRTRVYQSAQANDVERGRRVIEVLDRDCNFRDSVLRAAGFRCLVTGFGIGGQPASRLHGIVEAAHIRPVAANGPDEVSNGLALTPTVHKLFDAGLFTFELVRGSLKLRTSPLLRELNLVGERSRLVLEDGMVVMHPTDASSLPGPSFLEYHRDMVFRKTAG